ncbi:hypothetical protein FRB97_007631 [Tulasnella sp. 331]|nr:hypothetical protein FRB97_007631 [Tulasnella sp. 331]
MNSSLRNLALALLSISAFSTNALPRPQTIPICVPPPTTTVSNVKVIPGDAIAVGLTSTTTAVWELTNTNGTATLTTKGYDSGLLVSPGGGPFGAWDPTTCEYYFLEAAPTVSTEIPTAKHLTWSSSISSAGSTWSSAFGKYLVYNATGTSRFYACHKDTIDTTFVTYDLFLDNGVVVDPPPPTLPVACQVVQILVQ